MKENRMLPIGTETFRIFVDEAEDGVIRGRVSGGTLPEETLFRSLSRLILLLEEQLDTGGAPKASPIKCTETPTFELDILFRQNYSWQGRLRIFAIPATKSMRAASPWPAVFLRRTTHGKRWRSP